MIELFSDATVWLGLLTLVLLEIVLGIDNLIFIAILADKCRNTSATRHALSGLLSRC
jgi:predicted tellurium resistance membrane protein TerC